MRAVADRLVDRRLALIRLFKPPFDQTPHDPGYIKGYPTGVRENGGQYTHAALWTIWAFAELGEGDRAVDLFSLINPIRHAESAAQVQRYAIEPYVVAADVYTAEEHPGQGGWSWYTGSAGWMYRLGVEGILGLQRADDCLRLDPCLASTWPEATVTLRYGRTRYRIHLENPDGVSRGVAYVDLDDTRLHDDTVPLVDDGGSHDVRVRLGRVAGDA